MLLAPIACSDDHVAVDDEVGESGGGDEGPGPAGPGCMDHWSALDGPLEASKSVLPEHNPTFDIVSGDLVEFEDSAHGPDEITQRPNQKSATISGHPLTWADFVQRYARRLDGGWLVETDQYLTHQQLVDLYDRYQATWMISEDQNEKHSALLAQNAEFDHIWSSPRKLALTWCVGVVFPLPTAYPGAEEEHLERYDRIVRGMESSARAWERVADVNFVHLREFDTPDKLTSGACQPGQNGIWFRVRVAIGDECEPNCWGYTTAVPATEFDPEFAGPDNPDGNKRELVLAMAAAVSENIMNTTARHELGHVLGFAHEHERFGLQQPHCTPLTQWRTLTPPDPFSVMGYDFCQGIEDNQPKLSAYDRVGAFYQYTWARRNALIMAGGSSVKSLSYDGSGRTGIAWHRPLNREIELWTSTGSPGTPIEFDASHHCLSGAQGACTDDATEYIHQRPSPLFISGSAEDIDILLLSPGDNIADALHTNTSGLVEPSALPVEGYTVPIIGSFEHDIDDELLLYRPGPEEDELITFEPGGNLSSLPLNYSDYAIPLTGRYRGFGGGGNDIVWYQPHSSTLQVWVWKDFAPFQFWDTGIAEAEQLGLEDLTEYIPVLGDFSGDGKTDIFWYAPGATTDWLWKSVSNQDAVIFESFAQDVQGEYRPYVGDFDGDQIHDILWYAVANETTGNNSVIWYFDDDSGHETRLFTIHREYTPIVADFDNDECSDIFWFNPTDEDGMSPSWRCLPRERDFACDPPIPHPAQSFPIGSGGAY
ncbi:MAG: hypothetical protein HC927_03545 [Deltaproteobacteria bacterium]|nr:hypothetical protein [Deltaproteobacteria bacterium]